MQSRKLREQTTDLYYTIDDTILCSPFLYPPPLSMLCPAKGWLTPETVSAHRPWLVYAQIQSGGITAVEKHPAS